MRAPLLVVVAVALAEAAGCASSRPEGAVRALIAAAHDGDRKDVSALLGPRTVARLAADARVASEQAGRRRLAAADLLAAGWADATEDVTDVRVVERGGDRALVAIDGRRGQHERVEVVRVDGRWLVELP